MKNQTKRLLALLMSLAMMISLVVPASAVGADITGVTIAVDTSSITEELEPGSTFTVPVTISGNTTGFTNFGFLIEYDDYVLDLTSIYESDTTADSPLDWIYGVLLSKGTFDGYEETGKATFVGTNAITSNGTLYYLDFTVLDGAEAGPTTIDISLPDGSAFAYDPDGSNDTMQNIIATYQSGTVTIASTEAEPEYYTVNFNNITDYTEVSVEVGTEPSDMPTATKEADADGTTYSFSHWAEVGGDGTAIDWTAVAANESVTVYPVFTAVSAGQVAVNYTITTELDKTELDKTEYRSGDTFTATFSVSSTTDDANIGSFDMGIDYDDTLMTLKTLTAYGAYNSGATPSVNNANIGFTHAGTGVSVADNATLFTATFEVLDDVSAESTTITVDGGSYDDIKMTPVGYDSNAGTISTAGATAEIIKTIVITLEAESDAKGTIGDTTTFTMDSGKTLADVKAMSGYADPTASTNYVWTGWYDGDTLLEDTATFDENTTITAKFAAGSFTFAGDSANNTGVTITEGTGIDTTGDTAKVTYLTDATFEVTAPTGYILNSVTYAVSGGTASATGLTSSNVTATSGTYTIGGANITGAITIVVSVVEYHEVKFQSGTGSSMTTVTYYAKDGSANTGLYASLDDMVAGSTTDVEPTYTIDSGYRVADSAWITGTTETTFEAIQQADITADTTYTVNVVQTYEVKFVAGDSGNGTVAATTTNTYDTGTEVSVPTVTPNAGYEFAGWTVSTGGATLDSTATSLTATENVTYTATFTEGTYTVTFPTVTGVSFDTVTGATATADTKVYNATYSTDEDDYVTFTISTTGVVIDSVSYTVSGGTAVTIGADTDGVYKIPSSAITSGVSITVTADSLYTVAFTVGEDANGTVTGTTSFNVVDEGTLGSDNFAKVTVTPATGYQFDGWYIGDTPYSTPENEPVTDNVTYTAKFSQIQYKFTATAGTVKYVSGYGDDYATYGTNVTFTISSTDSIITGVKLGEVTLEATNGVYKIPGTSISGSDSELELTVSYFTGTMTFIDLDGGYLANVTEAADRKIMVLKVDGDTEGGTTYKLSTQVALYWSEKYEAYVTIVDDDETEATLSVGMTSTTGSATAIEYDGDLNGDGAVRSDDAGVVNDILHGKRAVTTTDMQMLMADLDGSKILSTADVTTVMNTVLGITADE